MLKIKILLAPINCYGPDPSGQATFYGGHKIIVLDCSICITEAATGGVL